MQRAHRFIAWLAVVTAVRAFPFAATALAAGPVEWVQLVPPAVVGLHVRDSKRDREIFFDQQGLLAVPDATTIEWQRIWSGANPASPARDVAFYDPLRDRIWTVSQSISDSLRLWSMDLSSDTPGWTARSIVWTAPGIGTNTLIQNPAYAFDPTRGRIMAFGGYRTPLVGPCYSCVQELSTVFSMTLGDTVTCAVETVEGSVPRPRGSAAMTYDPWRDRMIMWGGVSYGPIYYDETWTLSLGSPMRCTLLNPTQLPRPGTLNVATSLVDSLRQTWIVDGWELDLSSAVPADAADWTQLPVDVFDSVPSLHAPVAWFEQPDQSRIVLYDGTNLVLFTRGTPAWSVSFVTMGRLERYRPVAFVDAAREQIYAGLGVGQEPGGEINDSFQTRRLDRDQSWSPVLGVGPSPRMGALAVVDAAARRALVFGGGDRGESEQYSDLWSFDFDSGSWSLLASGNPPIKRTDALGVFDAAHRRLIVHGGFYTNPSKTALADTWIFDAAAGTWSSPPAGTDGAGWGAVGIYDPVQDRVISTTHGQVYVLPLAPTIGQWGPLATIGTAPYADSYTHAAAYDSIGDRMIVVGENGSSTGVWALSLSDPPTWTELTPRGTPPVPRYGAQLVSDTERGRMLLVGGQSQYRATPVGDDWVLYLHDLPAGSLTSTATTASEVTLSWHASESGYAATIERDDGSGWRQIGRRNPDGSGAVSWVDHLVVPGSSYDYRLSVFSPRGERVFGETHVEVPHGSPVPSALALEGLRPNPAVVDLIVAFSLPEGGRTTFELIDIAGRRVLERKFDDLAPGPQTVRLDEGAKRPAPGLYFIRMQHGGHVLSAKAVVGS